MDQEKNRELERQHWQGQTGKMEGEYRDGTPEPDGPAQDPGYKSSVNDALKPCKQPDEFMRKWRLKQERKSKENRTVYTKEYNNAMKSSVRYGTARLHMLEKKKENSQKQIEWSRRFKVQAWQGAPTGAARPRELTPE